MLAADLLNKPDRTGKRKKEGRKEKKEERKEERHERKEREREREREKQERIEKEIREKELISSWTLSTGSKNHQIDVYLTYAERKKTN